MTGYNCNICTGATSTSRQLQTCQLSHILDPSPAYPHWTPNLPHTGLLWVWSFFGLVVTLTHACHSYQPVFFMCPLASRPVYEAMVQYLLYRALETRVASSSPFLTSPAVRKSERERRGWLCLGVIMMDSDTYLLKSNLRRSERRQRRLQPSTTEQASQRTSRCR